MNKSDIVRDFITKSKITSKKEIARQMVELHPDKFKTIEDARALVRYVTGSTGGKRRELFKDIDKRSFFYNGFDKWATENLNTEPRPWDEPFIIPDSIKELNVIADLHSIHLNPKVMQKFMKQTTNKEALLINGDLMDSENLSRHIKGHNVIEYEKELNICHNILKELKKEFTHVYFKEGNHDFWLERYLLTNAREIFKLLGLDLKTLLRLGELGVHHIHNLRYIKYGDLDIVHGHEFSSAYGNGKFPATGYIDKWQTFRGIYDVKILAAHCHRQDYTVSKRSKTGEYGMGWVMPAMCRKAAGFNPYAGWDNGWAKLYNNDGNVNVKIVVV